MDIRNMKNTVILKNLPSNLVEEAIVVLKDNVKVPQEEFIINNREGKKTDSKNNDKNYIIKEAEMLITDYVTRIEKRKFKETKEKIRLEQKCKKLKFLSITLSLFSITSTILMFVFIKV